MFHVFFHVSIVPSCIFAQKWLCYTFHALKTFVTTHHIRHIISLSHHYHQRGAKQNVQNVPLCFIIRNEKKGSSYRNIKRML